MKEGIGSLNKTQYFRSYGSGTYTKKIVNKKYCKDGADYAQGEIKMKKTALISTFIAACLLMTACSNESGTVQQTSTSAASQETESKAPAAENTAEASSVTANMSASVGNAASEDEMFSSRDFEVGYSDASEINLSDGGTAVNGSGVSVNGNVITITEKGSYLFRGTLTDGQIVVDAGDEKVQIVLDGASVTSSGSAALYVKSADKVFVTTTAGSTNRLASAGEYSSSDEANIDGAVFAKDDITFNGSGSLEISSETAHGIVAKDDIRITSGTYIISAAKKGIESKESVRIADGSITITSGDDGIHAENSDNAEEGFVYICGGDIDITSGDDGIHAQTSLTVTGGDIDILKSKEGLEGEVILISGGSVNVNASDDGINAAGGSTDNSGNGGFGGMGDTDANAKIEISGGIVTVNADGDGIDSNGYILVSGGTVFVSGPVNDGNGALDSGISAAITGGSIIAAGSSGMAENFGSDSTQCSILYTFDGTLEAGTEISLTDADGNTLISYTPEKRFTCAVISTPDVKAGSTYTVKAGDKSYTVEMTSNIYGEGSSFGHGGLGQGGFPGRGDPFGGENAANGGSGEGTPPQMPDFANGERPELPNGEMPDFANGERPAGRGKRGSFAEKNETPQNESITASGSAGQGI